ncbi:MAG: hypothetical protein OHK0021_22070 [Bryobacter sp.]
MKNAFWLALPLVVFNAHAQQVTDRRQAEIRGGGGEGKCTIEVEVDDVAEVEIFGSRANIRTLSGSPSTFRRFQCNQEMPRNAYDFRFKGIDGRGRQDLVRSPGNGTPAVIRIEDSKGGREGYTFDIFWRGASGPWSGGNGNGGNRPGWNGGNGGGNNGGGWGNNGNNGWGNNGNNGWGNGNVESISFSGRRGNGDYRSSGGRSGALFSPVVRVESNGRVDLVFSSDQGNLRLVGNVDRRQGNRIYANVSGGELRGTVEIQVSGRNQVTRISMQDDGPQRYRLNWRN